MKSYYTYKRRRKIKTKLLIIISLIWIVVNFCLTTVLQPLKVNNDNMLPLYKKGDYILNSPFLYSYDVIRNNITINRGEVLSLRPPYAGSESLGVRFIDYIVRFFTLQKISTIRIHSKRNHSQTLSIGRIIGMPGEVVEIRDNIAYIQQVGKTVFNSEFEFIDTDYEIMNTYAKNTQSVLEPHYNHVELGVNDFFVINDNRLLPNDSRFWGKVNLKDIKGKVLGRYFPIRFNKNEE